MKSVTESKFCKSSGLYINSSVTEAPFSRVSGLLQMTVRELMVESVFSFRL